MMWTQQCNSITETFDIDLTIDILFVERFEVFLVGTQPFSYEIMFEHPILQYSIAKQKITITSIKDEYAYSPYLSRNNKSIISPMHDSEISNSVAVMNWKAYSLIQAIKLK